MVFRTAVVLIFTSLLGLAGCVRKPSPDIFPGEPIIRVLVMEGSPQIAVNVSHPARVRSNQSEVAVPIAGETAIIFQRADNGIAVLDEASGAELLSGAVLQLQPNEADGLFSLRDAITGATLRGDPTFEGVLEVRPDEGDALHAIVILPIEEYLRGVVPYEIGTTAPIEAMKAQAVAARSESLSALIERTYAGPHYDICSDVNCQVFRGTARRTDRTDAAIRETRGVALTWNGAPLPAYYSSNSGGYTEDIVNVWPHRDRGIPVWSGVFDGDPADHPGDLRREDNARAWILSRPNVYANNDLHPELPEWTRPNLRWQVTVSAEELSAQVARHKDIGRVVAIETGPRGPSARLVSVRFIGETSDFEIGPELAIRRTFQPALKSSAFIVEPTGPADRPDAFIITGSGYGHGVGMCQTGAMGRAHSGQNYAEILTHYYPGANVTKMYH